MLYEEGKGAPKDLELALRWYARAAAQGHSRAVRSLTALRSRLTCPWILNEVKRMQGLESTPARLSELLTNLLGDPEFRCMTSGRWTWEWKCRSEGGLQQCLDYVPDQGQLDYGTSDQNDPQFPCKCSRKKEAASPTK